MYLCFVAKIDFIEVDHTTWVIAMMFCEIFEIAVFYENLVTQKFSGIMVCIYLKLDVFNYCYSCVCMHHCMSTL